MALIGTISGSVGSGGVLTSRNAITGTLVVANTSTSFPVIPTDPVDAVLYTQGSIVATNEIHASGTIRLMNSSGDEGGELFLNKAVTNTTLNGGVTIDVYRNLVRFFEQGGTARGYYLDISNGGAGVSTNLSFSTSYTNAIFGDGSDGDVTISASTTMTREQHYNNLTIGTTGILKPRGFRIFVKGTLTIESGGSINDDGNNATGGTPGTGLGATGFLDGQSSAGGNSRGSLGAGNAGVALGSTVSLNSNGVLPVGGAGGASGTGQAGGAGGTCTQITPSQRWSSTAVQYAGRAAGSAQ